MRAGRRNTVLNGLNHKHDNYITCILHVVRRVCVYGYEDTRFVNCRDNYYYNNNRSRSLNYRCIVIVRKIRYTIFKRPQNARVYAVCCNSCSRTRKSFQKSEGARERGRKFPAGSNQIAKNAEFESDTHGQHNTVVTVVATTDQTR